MIGLFTHNGSNSDFENWFYHTGVATKWKNISAPTAGYQNQRTIPINPATA